MGLIKKQGTDIVPELFPAQRPELNILSTSKAIADVKTTQSILRDGLDDRIRRLSKIYINGTKEIVTWYSLRQDITKISSTSNTIDLGAEVATTPLVKFINMPIWLEGDPSYSIDEDTGVETVLIEAVTFPGFVPHIGDILLLPYRNGVTGLFKAQNMPQRMDIQREASYNVTLVLIHDITSESLVNIERRVVDLLYFNIKGFEYNNTPFTSQSALVDVHRLEKYLNKLDELYGSSFYQVDMGTLHLQDAPYDPYVVEFFRTCISDMADHNFVGAPNKEIIRNYWQHSAYAALVSEEITKNEVTTVAVTRMTMDARSPCITPLYGLEYMQLDPEGTVQYPMCKYIRRDLVEVSKISGLVYNFIDHRSIDVSILMEVCDELGSVTNLEYLFYVVPMVMFLCTQSIQFINNGEISKLTSNVYKPIHVLSFTSENLIAGHITVPLISDLILGIRTDTLETLTIASDHMVETDGVTTIDILSVAEENDISSITGIWQILSMDAIEKIISYEDI